MYVWRTNKRFILKYSHCTALIEADEGLCFASWKVKQKNSFCFLLVLHSAHFSSYLFFSFLVLLLAFLEENPYSEFVNGFSPWEAKSTHSQKASQPRHSYMILKAWLLKKVRPFTSSLELYTWLHDCFAWTGKNDSCQHCVYVLPLYYQSIHKYKDFCMKRKGYTLSIAYYFEYFCMHYGIFEFPAKIVDMQRLLQD